MLLDEEALANEQARIAPGTQTAQAPQPPELLDEEAAANAPPAEQPPPQPKPAPARPASPQEKKMFDKMLEQALMFLTSESSAKYLVSNTKTKSPEAVIAEAVQKVIEGISGAAQAAGIEIPPAVKGAATKAAIAALAGIMAKAGLLENPQQAARAALALTQKPAEQPPMEAADVPA